MDGKLTAFLQLSRFASGQTFRNFTVLNTRRAALLILRLLRIVPQPVVVLRPPPSDLSSHALSSKMMTAKARGDCFLRELECDPRPTTSVSGGTVLQHFRALRAPRRLGDHRRRRGEGGERR